MGNCKSLIIIILLTILFSFTLAGAAEKTPALKSSQTLQSLKKSSVEKTGTVQKSIVPGSQFKKTIKGRQPYIEIEKIYLNLAGIIIIELKNTGKGKLLKTDYAKGQLWVMANNQRRFYKLIKADPDLKLRNPGQKRIWSTGIKYSEKGSISAGVSFVNGEKLQSFKPQKNNVKSIKTTAFLKKKIRSKSTGIVITRYTRDNQMYGGSSSWFQCQLPDSATSGDIIFSLGRTRGGAYYGQRLIKPYTAGTDPDDFRFIFQIPAGIPPGSDYCLKAELNELTGSSSPFRILDPEILTDNHIVLHIEPSGETDSPTTYYAGSRIFVWYEMRDPVPENVRIIFSSLSSDRRRKITSTILYEGSARPGREHGTYYNIPPGILSYNYARIDIITTEGSGSFKSGSAFLRVIPDPDENNVVIDQPNGGETFTERTILLHWSYTNHGAVDSGRDLPPFDISTHPYSVNLVSRSGAVTPVNIDAGPSHTMNNYYYYIEYRYNITIPDHCPNGDYKFRVNYANGMSDISDGYFTLNIDDTP